MLPENQTILIKIATIEKYSRNHILVLGTGNSIILPKKGKHGWPQNSQQYKAKNYTT